MGICSCGMKKKTTETGEGGGGGGEAGEEPAAGDEGEPTTAAANPTKTQPEVDGDPTPALPQESHKKRKVHKGEHKHKLDANASARTEETADESAAPTHDSPPPNPEDTPSRIHKVKEGHAREGVTGGKEGHSHAAKEHVHGAAKDGEHAHKGHHRRTISASGDASKDVLTEGKHRTKGGRTKGHHGARKTADDNQHADEEAGGRHETRSKWVD